MPEHYGVIEGYSEGYLGNILNPIFMSGHRIFKRIF
jgi:hypothetical protein